MKKLILSLAAAAIMAAGFGAYKAYKSYQPKDNLLAMNIEALAQDENGERKRGDEMSIIVDYRVPIGNSMRSYV